MHSLEERDYKRLKSKYIGVAVVELIDEEGFMVFLQEKDGTLHSITDAMNGQEAIDLALGIGRLLGFEVQYESQS